MRQNMTDIPTPSGYDVYWEKWVDAYEEQAQALEQLVVEEDEEVYEEEEEMIPEPRFISPKINEELKFFTTNKNS